MFPAKIVEYNVFLAMSIFVFKVRFVVHQHLLCGYVCIPGFYNHALMFLKLLIHAIGILF